MYVLGENQDLIANQTYNGFKSHSYLQLKFGVIEH